ncbi:hypothetical protein [Streptomyces triculaminicus]|uniref:hypothetical protein n=1 Tax=Streptomyces triculaminicus TaxID=2816232 RepID=UPI0037D5FC46
MAANREVVLELECDANGVGSATVLCSPDGTAISAHGARLSAVVVRDLRSRPEED